MVQEPELIFYSGNHCLTVMRYFLRLLKPLACFIWQRWLTRQTTEVKNKNVLDCLHGACRHLSFSTLCLPLEELQGVRFHRWNRGLNGHYFTGGIILPTEKSLVRGSSYQKYGDFRVGLAALNFSVWSRIQSILSKPFQNITNFTNRQNSFLFSKLHSSLTASIVVKYI